VLLLCLLVSGCSGAGKNGNAVVIGSNTSIPQQGKLIEDIYPDKSAYRPGEKVTFTVQFSNQTGKDFSGIIVYVCKSQEKTVYQGSAEAAVRNGEKTSLTLSWTPPNDDYKGYLVESEAVSGGTLLDHRNTAVDVSSDWKKYPRYGYLCKFPQMTQKEMDAVVDRLSKYHINGLQFYDWQDSHDKPLAVESGKPAAKWEDIAGRDTYGATVRSYIEKLHKKNMTAANYNLMYGAYDGFESRGISAKWALYADESHGTVCAYSLPANWESSINLMNPQDSGWSGYILGQEKKVFEAYPFDVFHIDTLGNQGETYDYNGNEVVLSSAYSDFLKRVKPWLGKGFVLNTVNEYGIEAAAASDVDFLYTEVWPNSFADYAALQRAATDNLNAANGKKAVVIAAYVNYGVSSGEFNPNAVKLTDAALFASGADHLELGDTGMLSSEYFPNEKLSVPASLAGDLRSYYDFLTAYEGLLRSPAEITDFNGSIAGSTVSGDATIGTVWAFEKKEDNCRVVHLINLLSRSDSQWRDDGGSCEAPKKLTSFTVELDNPDEIQNVYLASPDLYGGSMLKLDYTRKDGKLSVTVPSLEYWDMLVIQTKSVS